MTIPCQQEKTIDRIEQKLDKIDTKIDSLMEFRFSWTGKMSVIIGVFSLIGSGLVSWLIKRNF